MVTLASLIGKYTQCRNQLVEAIANDADNATLKAIDAQLVRSLKAIENIELYDAVDIQRQIKFFLRQPGDLIGEELDHANLKSVEKLIDRYTGRFSTGGKTPLSIGSTSSRLQISWQGQDFWTKNLIERPELRTALLNTELQYKFTSVANARFYGAETSDFVGKHVMEFIGEHRFLNRAKAHFEHCFAGYEQRYSYHLDVPETGERLMYCHMVPYYDSDDCVRGAYVTIDDITDQINHSS